MDYIKIVEELNEDLFERFGDTDRVFTFSTNGLYESISFGEIHIWDSEGCERVWIEEKKDYEPFKPFIIRTFNETMDGLFTCKF